MAQSTRETEYALIQFVDSYNDLITIPGRNNIRSFTRDTKLFYYWDEDTLSWTLEPGNASGNGSDTIVVTSMNITSTSGLIFPPDVDVIVLTSSNSTETVTSMSGVGLNKKIRFQPEPGLTVTFIATSNIQSPGTNELIMPTDFTAYGNNKDWIVFEGYANNTVRQTDAMNYQQIIVGGGGGGSALEDYQNSVMSTTVKAYVYRDENDNIIEVYEPIKGNRISRQDKAYEDTIDRFPFIGLNDCFNVVLHNTYLDVPEDIIMQNVVANNSEFRKIGESSNFTNVTLEHGARIFGFDKFGLTFLNVNIREEGIVYVVKENSTLGSSVELGSQGIVMLSGVIYDLVAGPSSFIGGDVLTPGIEITNIDIDTKTITVTGDVTGNNKLYLAVVIPEATAVQNIFTIDSISLNGGVSEIVVLEDLPTDIDTTMDARFLGYINQVGVVTIENSAFVYIDGNNLVLENCVIFPSEEIRYSTSKNNQLVFKGNNFPQMGIGTSDIPSCAIVKFESSIKGSMPFPLMTEAEKNAISSPKPGLHIYQTDNIEGVYVYKSNETWVFAY